MKHKYIFTALLLLLLTAAGTLTVQLGKEDRTENEAELRVVTSFYPMYVAAENIMGDIPGVTLSNLTEPQTGCLHDYQLTPQDMVLLSTADLFIINGGGIESFAEEVAGEYPQLTILTASEGIPFLAEGGISDGLDFGEEDHEHDHGHDHGEVNAHVWMDVSRYEQEVENIAAGLAALDPEHADVYRGNTDAYVQRLDALKEKVKELKGRGAGKKIIIFHDAFAYFADASGMEISYVIDMDENTSLSANMVSELVELVRADDIDLLFAEAQYGTKIADAVSRETGAKVYVLDSLVTGDMDKDSYIRGMEENLRILEEALKEE
ncbi:MAG: metal ABC transporter substrate-binding protein [Lachnospiraceae bacterium]|nr:metal ABC transporter substrate-binding protein [Lachnospiraceae bacterium]